MKTTLPSTAEAPESHYLLSALVWLILLAIAYFASDIIAKGQVLNELTPYPVFGYVLWALIAWVLWFFLLSPFLQFYRLRRAQYANPERQAQKAIRKLRPYFRKESPEHPLHRLYCELYAVRHNTELEKDVRYGKLVLLLQDYREASGIHAKARGMILNYSRLASLGVVFSRNSLLDGLILLVLQMRLVVSLASLHGYKPSPVFNTLCFGWVLCNSFTMALIGQQQADALGNVLGEEFADYMSELFSGADEMMLLGADAIGTKFCQKTISILIEAIMGASVVYVTGHIFLRKLEHDGSALSLQTLLRLRREGRLAIGKDVLTVLPARLAAKATKNVVSSAAAATGTVAANLKDSVAHAIDKTSDAAQSFMSKLNNSAHHAWQALHLGKQRVKQEQNKLDTAPEHEP